MAFLTPLWMQDQTYSATQFRQFLGAMLLPGVLTPADLVVTQRAAGANMSVDVSIGNCVVAGTDVAGQGNYFCGNTAVANVPLATAPGTGNSRIDLIIARVRDQDAIGGTNSDWLLDKVTGTAAATGSQVAPAVPASCLLLDRVAVGPSVTTITNANITDVRTYATPKPITRVITVPQSATPAWNSDTGEVFKISGLASAITSLTSGHTGTLLDEQLVRFKITDNGTARAITYGSLFVSSGTILLPTTTAGTSTSLRIGFQYDADLGKLVCNGVA